MMGVIDVYDGDRGRSVRTWLAPSPAWSNPGHGAGQADHCSSLDQRTVLGYCHAGKMAFVSITLKFLERYLNRRLHDQ